MHTACVLLWWKEEQAKRRRTARQGKARQGKARQGKYASTVCRAGQGRAGQGRAGQGREAAVVLALHASCHKRHNTICLTRYILGIERHSDSNRRMHNHAWLSVKQL